MSSPKIMPLRGAIQHYDWGGFEYIPNLIGIKNADHKPFAELWMGAHPSAPAILINNGATTPLDYLVKNAPQEILGDKVADRFDNRLPYLFKVLDVRKMLSIQAHPTKKQAEEGFQRENDQNIPLDAKHRNYKDDNHKPEVMVALTDFWLLHGFKSIQTIRQTLAKVPEFRDLQPIVAKDSLYDLYKHVMEMPQNEANAMLAPLEQRLKIEQPSKDSPDYWAKQAFNDHPPKDGNYDRGIFSIYFFNLVQLKPGQGIFQGAGVPHAYLEGVNVELMANSDNVFRGGLTSKHVDVPELLKSLIFEQVVPKVISGAEVSDTERVYPTPAPDFELSKIDISQNKSHYTPKTDAPHIMIVIKGTVTVNDDQTFTRGDIFFAPANVSYELDTETNATIFKATVP